MKWTVYSKEKPQKIGSYLVTHTTVSGRYYVDYDYWTVCDEFKYHPTDVVAWMPFPEPFNAERKDEPQTQLTAKCLECNNSKACKENHWEGCRYEPLGYEVTAVVGTIEDKFLQDREGE